MYLLDPATKKGQHTKLKSPWKGPVLISTVRSSTLYRVCERKRENP